MICGLVLPSSLGLQGLAELLAGILELGGVVCNGLCAPRSSYTRVACGILQLDLLGKPELA